MILWAGDVFSVVELSTAMGLPWVETLTCGITGVLHETES